MSSGNGSRSPSATWNSPRKPLLLEIRAGQVDRRRGEVDARDQGAAFRKAGKIDPGAAPDFENLRRPE